MRDTSFTASIQNLLQGERALAAKCERLALAAGCPARCKFNCSGRCRLGDSSSLVTGTLLLAPAHPRGNLPCIAFWSHDNLEQKAASAPSGVASSPFARGGGGAVRGGKPVAQSDCNFNFRKPFWFIVRGVVLSDFAWVESKKKGSILSFRVILSFSGDVS